jgi:hypothetical protein
MSIAPVTRAAPSLPRAAWLQLAATIVLFGLTWPVILSVGTLQLSSFFALANLGVQSVPPGRWSGSSPR